MKFLEVISQDKDTLTAEQLKARAEKARLLLEAEISDAEGRVNRAKGDVIDAEADIIGAVRQEPFNAGAVLYQIKGVKAAQKVVAVAQRDVDDLKALLTEWF
jgi:hypothetical protein